ncbi:MAG TPA: OmpH family outer membrane protein [Candidatus Baltobacteraceae bacterium]|nr:OmpH family outer membrane protein [Candidatus Baltobacteraceae bacterium]
MLRAGMFGVALVGVAVFAGCSHVDVNSPQIRGVAYVHMDQVVKHHPLYGQLAQLEDAMTAINLAAAGPHVPKSAAEIAAGVKDLNAQLRDAQNRANKIIGQKQQEYSQKERQADAAALSAAGIDSSALRTSSQMNATSAAQAQDAAQSANRDFMAYQQSVLTQDNAATRAVAEQLQKQADQKFRARAEADQQDETDLSLRLAQQDATQRLALKTKLNNLALDTATRTSVQSQLAALDRKEGDAVNVLRERHQRELTAYRAQLGSETNAAIGKQIASIRSQTQAKLSARRDAVGTQLRSLGAAPPALPNVPPNVAKKLAQIHAQYQSMFQGDVQKSVADYNTTKSDLDRQFAALHGADVGATGAAAAELASLQKHHDDLQAQINDQIHREAEKIAKQMGFTVVFDNVAAAPGGYDLTNDLIHDVESLHE